MEFGVAIIHGYDGCGPPAAVPWSTKKALMSDPKPAPKETVDPKECKSINRHFLREGRWMVWLGVGLPILSLVVAFLLGPVLLNALNK